MRNNTDTVLTGEIMTTTVRTVHPDTPVSDIVSLLNHHKISGVPVVGPDEDPIGIISELDVISRSGSVASDIMSGGVISVTEDTPAEEIVEILRTSRVRRVPVLRDGRIVGIVSRSDLVRLFSRTRWTCSSCGYFVRGFQRPSLCSQCGSTMFQLDREPPGM